MYLSISIFLFATVILQGAYLVFHGVRKRKRVPALGMTHAAMALVATVFLFIHIYTGPSSIYNNFAAFFFLFALIGGVLVFLLHEENHPPSMAAVIIHALAGVTGLVSLVLGWM